MKVLHLSVYDTQGGAQRASYRLHQGLSKVGTHSQVLVAKKFSNDKFVVRPRFWSHFWRLRFELSLRQEKKLGKQEQLFVTPTYLPDGIQKSVQTIQPDIVNLHWVSGGYLNPSTLKKIKKPIVWTLHDMWAFTGGCHYAGDCQRYQNQCGQCPMIGSDSKNDVSHKVWQKKKKEWDDLDNMTIVTPSRWLADCAKNSSLFSKKRVEVIPYGLDLEKFKPVDRKLSRELLGIPNDKKVILFGALSPESPRKGYKYLESAIEKLEKSSIKEKIEIAVFGGSRDSQILGNTTIPIRHLGRFSDDLSLAVIYSASDLFIAPSTEDNLPNTVLESMACGTPVVAFSIGGMTDMIDHKINGFLADPFDSEQLAKGVEWMLQDTDRCFNYSEKAREKAEKEYALETQAYNYIDLYKEIVF